ncbi:uncharacterized protein ACN2A1_008623 [Glossina fuscipes fuscipes]
MIKTPTIRYRKILMHFTKQKQRTYSDPMAGAGAGGGGIPPPRSRSLERLATSSSKQPPDSKTKQTLPSDLRPYQGPPRPRAYSESKIGAADPYESYYRSRSVEGEVSNIIRIKR